MAKVTDSTSLVNDAAQYIVEPPDFFRLSGGHEASAPKLVSLEHGDAWSFEDGAIVDPVGLEVAAARLPGVELKRTYRYDELGSAATSATERVAAMDLDRIGRAAVFPTYGLNLLNVRDDDLHRDGIRSYNDGIAQWCHDGGGDRLLPQGLIPATGLDDALAELDRVIGLGFRGVVLAGWPGAGRTPEPEDDRFWARCEEAGVVLALIRGGTTVSQRGVRQPVPSTLGRYAGAAGKPEDLAPIEALITDLVTTKNHNLTWLILTGVLERFPALQVLLVQAGTGWLPTCGEIIDWNYRYAQFVPGNGFAKLKDVPSDYMRRQIFATAEPDQPDVTYIRQRGCADKVLWASGFPTSISAWPTSHERATEQAAGLDGGLQNALLRANFDALFSPAGVHAGA